MIQTENRLTLPDVDARAWRSIPPLTQRPRGRGELPRAWSEPRVRGSAGLCRSERCLAAGPPDDFVGDRGISGVPAAAGKQPRHRFASQPPIMLSQFVEQMGAEHDVAVLATLAAANVDDHALGVEVGHLEMGQFGPPHPGGIQGYQDRAMKWVHRGLDQAGDLFLT